MDDLLSVNQHLRRKDNSSVKLQFGRIGCQKSFGNILG
jgi:hypothetical protein